MSGYRSNGRCYDNESEDIDSEDTDSADIDSKLNTLTVVVDLDSADIDSAMTSQCQL